MLKQMRDIIFFVGPVLGIWLFGPLMSLIDTAVVGNSSSLELAALGELTLTGSSSSVCFVRVVYYD
jgi:Na+-driven multidrug efflux pump